MAKKKSRESAVKADSTLNKLLPHAVLIFAALFLYTRALVHPYAYDSTQLAELDFYNELLSGFSPFSMRVWPQLLFALIHKFYGESPTPQMAVNLLFHTLNGILIYQITTTIFSRLRLHFSKALPLFIALLFILSPIGVYAVAYHIQRFVIMALFFSLLMHLLLIKAWCDEKPVFYFAGIVCYYFAITCKEQAAVSLLVSAVILFTLNRPTISQIKKTVPYLVVLFFMAGVALYKNQHILFRHYEYNAQHMLNAAVHPLAAMSTPALHALSALNQAGLFFRYLFLTIVPYTGWMSIYGPLPFPQGFSLAPACYGISFLVFVCSSLFLIFKPSPSLKLVGLALATVALSFLPEFWPIRITENFALYRAYLWTPFLFLTLPWVHEKIIKNKTAFFASLALLGILFTLIAKERLATMSDQLVLWQDAADKVALDAEKRPGSYRIYTDLGLANLEKSRIKDAITALETAVKLYPQYTDALNKLGVAHTQIRDYEKALNYFDQVLTIDKKNVLAHVNRGGALNELKRVDEAYDEYKIAVELDPQFISARLNLANLCADNGKLDEAKANYEEILNIDPKHSLTHFNLGNLLKRMRNVADAKNHYKLAIMLDDKMYQAKFNLALILIEEGQTDEALKNFSDVIRLNPQIADAYFNVGVIYARQGKHQMALDYFKRTLNIDANHALAQDALTKLGK